MFRQVDPHPNFPKLEEEILKFWEEEKIFEKSLEKTRPKSVIPAKAGIQARPRLRSGVDPRVKPEDEKHKLFTFYEGPPTANAAPGIHHVEARAFKDLIPRFQTMRGKYVERKAGWDTHGLPVELQVEKQLGISGKKQIESLKATVKDSIAYFNKLCRESVWQYKEEWERLTRRMGFWIDMKNPYITYENPYIEKVWGILKQIWDKDLIYQGHKVVPYCPRCGTALSSHEVAQGYERVKENSVYVKFKVKNNAPQSKYRNIEISSGGEGELYLLSWTTTPWTLPGNVALAVGEEIDYVMFEKDGEYFIAAKTPTFSPPHEGEKEGVIVKKIKGHDLVGLEYEPLFDISSLKNEKSHHVYSADFVTTEEGTGVVHTAVMYGEDDYQLGEKIGLPKHHTVDEEGKFKQDLQKYGLAGLPVRPPTPPPPLGGEELKERGKSNNEAEHKIIAYLKSKNLLFKVEPYEHDYPFCWRCGHALLYYARNSWFIRMSALREKLIKNNEKINWIPEYIQNGRFGEWLRGVKDWAISRERYWGTPLPFWKCENCGEYEVIGSIKELGKKEIDLHRPYVDDIVLKCKQCGGESKRIPEVLDVWFDSGAMPFVSGVSGFPADYISEAIDQTRGWFYTLLAISTLLEKGPAYRNVICLGHVLDEKGEKMSKSKGNIINPFEVGDKFGFDTIRWYFYSVNQPGDSKRVGVKDFQDLMRRHFLIFWNVYSYFVTYANTTGWKLQDKTVAGKNALDLWVQARLSEVANEVTSSLDTYDTFHAVRAIEAVVSDLSVWYIRRSRGRGDKEFFANLYQVLITLCKLSAPFAPFVSEYIYRNLTQEESVHLSDWPKMKKLTKKQTELLKQMREIRKIAEEVHALRAKSGLKLRQPLAKLVIPETPLPSPLMRGERGGSQREEFLGILKDEVNVLEIVYGPKLELDTKITPELKIAGLSRELERQIQAFRKESGLKIGEMVDLYYQTKSAMMKKAMDKVDRKKVYVKNMEYRILNVGGKTIEVEGERVKFLISNI